VGGGELVYSFEIPVTRILACMFFSSLAWVWGERGVER